MVKIISLMLQILVALTLKNMHQLNDQGKIKAWLIRIATNTAYDFLRLKARYLVLEDPTFI